MIVSASLAACDEDNDEQKATAYNVGSFRDVGRDWLYHCCAHCSAHHRGILPGWTYTYQTCIFTARAAAWADLGDIWSVSFIVTSLSELIDETEPSTTTQTGQGSAWREDSIVSIMETACYNDRSGYHFLHWPTSGEQHTPMYLDHDCDPARPVLSRHAKKSDDPIWHAEPCRMGY